MNTKICFIAIAVLFAVNLALADNDDDVMIVGDDVVVVDDDVVMHDDDVVTDDDVVARDNVGHDDVAVVDDDDVFVFDDEIEIEVVEEEDDIFEAFPQLTGFVDAEYPQELQDEGVRGNVLLELVISETGAVDSVWVARSLHPTLDTNAMNAVRQFTFSPAKLRTGEYVAVMLQYEYRFHFEEVITTVEVDDTTSIDDDDIVAANQRDIVDGFDDEDAAFLDDNFELTVYGRERTTEVARHRLTITEVKRIPGLGGEALRVVQAMPGVARPSFGGNDVIVRGLPSWASRYFIDGMSVPLIYHFGGMTSSYPSEAVEAVDFYPGGFSTRYGGAVGGIIDMTSRKSNSDSLRGYADLSLLDGALFLEGPINERVSFMASARRGFAGDLLALYFEHFDPSGISMAPFYYDYLLRADVKLDDDHHLYVSFMGSWDSVGVFMPDMDVSGRSSEIGGELDQLNLRVDFHMFMLGLDSRFNDEWKNTLRFSLGYNGANMGMFGMARMSQNSYLTSLRNQLTYAPRENVTLHLGADVELMALDMELAINSAQNFIIREKMEGGIYGSVGAYAIVEWRPVERLLLAPGVRYDYYPELDYSGSLLPEFWSYSFNNRRGAAGEPAFRISGRYDILDGHTAKGAVGTYSQQPEPRGFVVHEAYGEPTLPSTKGAQYVAGYEWQITDLINLDAQTYYNHMWDVPRQYDPRIDFDADRETQPRYFHDGRGRSYGVELMLRHSRSDRFFGWVSYTLSRSERWSVFEDRYILSDNDEPHHLQLMGSWSFQNGWDFGVRARYVSGKPTSPVIGIVERENDKDIRPIYGDENSTRHDPFFQLDLRVDKKIQYNRWALTYYVDLQNVLWPLYKSPEFSFYNYNYTERQIIAMIPMISTGIRAEF